MRYLRKTTAVILNIQRRRLSNRIRIIVAISVCLLPATLVAGIGDFGDSLDVTLYKLASENNDPSAQYLIARKYFSGKSVVKNTKEAIRWFEHAAKQNHSKAQFQLGLIYLKGLGVKVDRHRARDYLLSAANNGLDEAQFELAQFYRSGYGGPKNTHKAVKWFKKSIKQDNILALVILGKMYLHGKGVRKDPAEAMKWLGKAAKTGDFQAAKLVANYKRDHPEFKIQIETPAKNNKSQKSAKKKTSAKSNKVAKAKSNTKLSTEEMLQNGMNYLHGEHGFEKNVAKGVGLLKRAAEKGHAVAQYDYGMLLAQGNDIDKDLVLAIEWLKKAAKAGIKQAEPVLTDVQLELLLSDKAKYVSKPDEQFKLANRYLLGDKVEKSTKEAFQWFLKAARQEHLASQYQVGEMYYNGFGTAQNTKKAEYWLVKASRRGVAEAEELLQQIDSETDKAFETTNAQLDSRDKQSANDTASTVNEDEGERQEKPSKRKGKPVVAEESNNTLVMRSSSIQRKNRTSIEQAVGKVDEKVSTAIKGLISKAKQGESESQFLIAKKYLSGEGIKQDISKGIEWLMLSAKNKHLNAQVELGTMLLNGKNIEKNYSEAYRWINAAATQGDPGAQLVLGDIYKKGLGVKQSNSKAIKWYRKAANRGNKVARRRLGGCRVC